MAIKNLLVVFILLFSTGAFADDLFYRGLGDNEVGAGSKYDASQNSWTYGSPHDALKYNVFQDRWNYAREGDALKYNTFESEWDFAGEDDSLKYNVFENKWEYADDNDQLKRPPPKMIGRL
jgi:hypothetical protein